VSLLLVTGTGTGVGKTVVTAAVAALAVAGGRGTAVVKVAQTGVGPGEAGDMDEVHRLAAVPPGDLHELARLGPALSPEAAARLEGLDGPALADCARDVAALAAGRDLALVEGAGGLLVRFDASGWTLADLATSLGAPVLVVAEAGLGTLNATALTTEALRSRGIGCAGVVLGSWPVPPAMPGLAERSNLYDLERVAGAPLAGVLPAGAARLEPDAFLAAARAGLSPMLGGTFDAADFRRIHTLQ
jgi:dethiobiotin synthetase